MPSRITLLTDFGTRDGYVGALKGVLASAAPGALLDDISHDIVRGDVRGAQYALARYWRLFPEGTVHLAVVDPGVGTSRRAAACEADGRMVVAPDNGLLTPVLVQASRWRAVEITRAALPPAPSGMSKTFHGRDVFAPAAAHLAVGRSLEALGPSLLDPVRLTEPEPVRTASGGSGAVVAVDHYGNLLTNIPGAWLSAATVVRVAGRSLRVVSTYGHAEPEEVIALVSSDGRVEVARRGGSAAETLSAGVGSEVELSSPK